MTDPFKPIPPDGYRLHRQIVTDTTAKYEPNLPIWAFESLMVYNGWQQCWEKPKFIFTGESAWLATKKMAP